MIDIKSMMQMLGQLKQDPRKVLMQRFNIRKTSATIPRASFSTS